MKQPLKFLLIFFILATGVFADNSWIKISDTDGILTYQKSNGSRILEVKGVVIIDARIDVAGNIFRAIDLHPKWVGYCEKAELIESVSRNHYLFYEILKPPWPVAQRDMVVEAKSEYFDRELFVSILSRAISSQLVSETKKYVRIRNMQAKVSIEYITGNKTGITYEIMADPGGNIPEFIVNLFNQVYVYQIMTNLRKIAQDEVYTKVMNIEEDSQLLNRLLANKKILQSTLKNRLARFIDSKENIEFLVNDDSFLNLWLDNKNHLAEQLFFGNHEPSHKKDAIKKIIECYLARYNFSPDAMEKLSGNPGLREMFTREQIKDVLTPELLQKVLSGKSQG